MTPYKILLKSGKNNHSISNNNLNVNKENMLKDVENQIDEAFSGIHISDKKEYRFSLQIGVGGAGAIGGRQISSGIKNKIVNQKSEQKLK